jgi:cysteine desulfuration protein SufE
MGIIEVQNEIIDEFSLFEDWMQRYEYMIELGKSIELIDSSKKIDSNLIKGCQSKLWLHAELNNNKLIFKADSEAIITKGIAAVLNANLDFVDKIGLKEHLSPSRANGLISMIKQIKYYALAYTKN